MLYSTHVNHVIVSPNNVIGTTQGQRKTLTRVGIELSCLRTAAVAEDVKRRDLTLLYTLKLTGEV